MKPNYSFSSVVSRKGSRRTGEKNARKPALGLLMLLLLAPVVFAKELDGLQVKTAVETWVRNVTADARPDAVVEKMEPFVVEGLVTAYVVHLAGGGYCLCGADDLVLPVYLYSPNGRFDSTKLELRDILDGIGYRLSAMRAFSAQLGPTSASYQTLISERVAYWADLKAGRVPAKRQLHSPQLNALAAPGANALVDPTTNAVDLGTNELDDPGPDTLVLPFTAQWQQGTPYNDQCPELVPGSDSTHTYVGCTATAAAQIMYFWKWPITGEGSLDEHYIRRYSADWQETPLANDPNIPAGWEQELGQGSILDWANGMLRMRGYWDSSLNGWAYWTISTDPDFTAAHDTLFANMPDVGTTTNINFGATTYHWDLLRDVHTNQQDAGGIEVAQLCHHMGVAIGVGYGVTETTGGEVVSALKTHFRYDPDATVTSVTDPTAAMLDISEDLRWFRPVGLGGCAHHWVTYGYSKATDPNRQFLMNLGGGPGSDHVWETFDAGPEAGFCSGLIQLYETRIAPSGVVGFVGASSSGNGSPNSPYQNVEEALAKANDQTTLIFKAGSVNTFSTGPLVINRPMTLKGVQATITD